MSKKVSKINTAYALRKLDAVETDALESIATGYGQFLNGIHVAPNFSCADHFRAPSGVLYDFTNDAPLLSEPFSDRLFRTCMLYDITGMASGESAGEVVTYLQSNRPKINDVFNRVVREHSGTEASLEMFDGDRGDIREWEPTLNGTGGHIDFSSLKMESNGQTVNKAFLVIQSDAGEVGNDLFHAIEDEAYKGKTSGNYMTMRSFFQSPRAKYAERLARRNCNHLAMRVCNEMGLQVSTMEDPDTVSKKGVMARPLIETPSHSVDLTSNPDSVLFRSNLANTRVKGGILFNASPQEGVYWLQGPADLNSKLKIEGFSTEVLVGGAFRNDMGNSLAATTGRTRWADNLPADRKADNAAAASKMNISWEGMLTTNKCSEGLAGVYRLRNADFKAVEVKMGRAATHTEYSFHDIERRIVSTPNYRFGKTK
jgi:hypothetical protein